MPQQMESVSRYMRLRQLGMPFNTKLTKALTKWDMEEGARKIGIFQDGKIVLEDDSTIAVLMDFCLHDIWRDGFNAIERFYRLSPPPIDSDEMMMLEAKRAARFSMFMANQLEPGVGVHVRDLLYDE